jgi:hypothetical protein
MVAFGLSGIDSTGELAGFSTPFGGFTTGSLEGIRKGSSSCELSTPSLMPLSCWGVLAQPGNKISVTRTASSHPANRGGSVPGTKETVSKFMSERDQTDLFGNDDMTNVQAHVFAPESTEPRAKPNLIESTFSDFPLTAHFFIPGKFHPDRRHRGHGLPNGRCI